jgi:hypothetical protein
LLFHTSTGAQLLQSNTRRGSLHPTLQAIEHVKGGNIFRRFRHLFAEVMPATEYDVELEIHFIRVSQGGEPSTSAAMCLFSAGWRCARRNLSWAHRGNDSCLTIGAGRVYKM